MARLDVYLRSIEKFGASGALLASGQAVTLRFPTGDRHSTQVTPHSQLVLIVREVAPAGVFDQIDKGRPARFDLESAGNRYAVSVTPRGGTWQIAIDAATGAAPAAGAAPAPASAPATTPPPAGSAPAIPPPAPAASAHPASPPVTTPLPAGSSSAIPPPPPTKPPTARMRAATPPPALVGPAQGASEGGPADTGGAPAGAALDLLTRAARAAGASDLYLSASTVAVHRVAGELVSAGAGAIEGDVIARELGAVAPPEARAAWNEKGTAMFTYGDGAGRVRVTLARDHRGPSAALRLLPDAPPSLAQLGLGDAGEAVQGWLGRRGLIVIAGPSGCGKTVTMGALVRALGERRRRVVVIEDPIELVHASAWISQRAVGEHVASVSTGVACAMNEGADAIVIGRVSSEGTARGVVEAVSGGHLVLTTAVAPFAGVALDRMIAHLASDQRELAHGLLFSALLGTIQPLISRSGERSFEITSPQT